MGQNTKAERSMADVPSVDPGAQAALEYLDSCEAWRSKKDAEITEAMARLERGEVSLEDFEELVKAALEKGVKIRKNVKDLIERGIDG